MNLEEENNFLVKSVFYKSSNKAIEICSNKCQMNVFEDYMCKTGKGLDSETANYIAMNYESALKCYDNCIAKHLMSLVIGVEMVDKKVLK
jgi:hypothetical protein